MIYSTLNIKTNSEDTALTSFTFSKAREQYNLDTTAKPCSSVGAPTKSLIPLSTIVIICY